MSMGHWWNDTNRGTEVLGEKHYTASVVDEWVWSIGGTILTVETEQLAKKTQTPSLSLQSALTIYWWNDTDRGTEVLGEKHYTASVVYE
jgi:hypothetical protein